MTESELLRRYAAGGTDAQEAFAMLVRLHADWVLGVARRRVGDEALAEDVAQAAFIVLATKGRRLSGAGTPLGPWLFRVTCFAASRAVRDRARRHRHERAYAAQHQQQQQHQQGAPAGREEEERARWDEIAPVLDHAVERLRPEDRRAVLLRFYQQLSLAQVGQSLGISEEAARKRVARAVGRLRDRLAAQGVQGVQVAPAALAGVLLANVTEASTTTAVHASTWAAAATGAQGPSATSTGLAKGAMKMILWNKAKASAAAVLMIAAVIGGVSLGVHAVVAQQPPPSRAVRAGAEPNTLPDPAVFTIEAENVLFAISPDRKQLAAFSKEKGEWQPLPTLAGEAGDPATTFPVDNWGDRIVVSQNIGTYRHGPRVHAFSGVTGTWDTLTLPDTRDAPQVLVSSTTAMVSHERNFYIFSAATGKWTEPPFQEKE